MVGQWYADYLDCDKETLFELMLSAHQLEFVEMMEIVGAKISTVIWGKSVKEMRQYFGIANDFAPEEE